MRQNGAKALAWDGQAIASIQRAGGWGLLAATACVEEAGEEFLPAQAIPAVPARPERQWKDVKGTIVYALRAPLPCRA